MALRITGTTKGCEDCRFKSYYSGGLSECTKTNSVLPHGYTKQRNYIAPNCPLPVWPEIPQLNVQGGENEK